MAKKNDPKAVTILKRFAHGKKVEDDEYDIIEPYSHIGIIKFGFSFRKKEVQASLTQKGKNLIGINE